MTTATAPSALLCARLLVAEMLGLDADMDQVSLEALHMTHACGITRLGSAGKQRVEAGDVGYGKGCPDDRYSSLDASAPSAKLATTLAAMTIAGPTASRAKFVKAQFFIDRGVRHVHHHRVRRHRKTVTVTSIGYTPSRTITALPANLSFGLGGLKSGLAHLEDQGRVSQDRQRAQTDRDQDAYPQVQRLRQVDNPVDRDPNPLTTPDVAAVICTTYLSDIVCASRPRSV
jgi:hypothetical protein